MHVYNSIHRCKKRFHVFFILATFFALFNVLFIFQRFYYKKNIIQKCSTRNHFELRIVLARDSIVRLARYMLSPGDDLELL